MIKDITLGQYFPGSSVVHNLDARFKLVITLLFIIMLFIGGNAICLEVGTVFTAAALLCSSIPFKMIAKSLKPILPILLFTTILNLFMITGGIPLFQWKFISITDEAVETSVFMIIRILLLIAGTSLLTYTTSPVSLTDAIERLLSPLKRFKLPVHELAMMMTIALRFIPTLIEETDKIMSAQKAARRGYGGRRNQGKGEVRCACDSAVVCIGSEKSRRACDCHGVPLLPRRRGKNQNEAVKKRNSRLYFSGYNVVFSCRCNIY